jgi:hypothetical protein
MRVRKKKENEKAVQSPSIHDVPLDFQEDRETGTEQQDELSPYVDEKNLAKSAQFHEEESSCAAESFDDEPTEEINQGRPVELKLNSSQLTLKLSQSLMRKLQHKAQVEGVSVEDLAGELISEGVMLRAWEIMEKKTAMRGVPQGGGVPQNFRNNNNNNQQQQPRFGFRNQNNFSRNRSNQNSNQENGSQGGGRQGYRNIMEDNANFMEYVRSQEKKQPR